MNRTVLVLFAVPLLAISSVAHALANRVFVSARSGNNANSCDNINTPCQTFAGAVLQLNSGGEAIVLDSGGYRTGVDVLQVSRRRTLGREVPA